MRRDEAAVESDGAVRGSSSERWGDPGTLADVLVWRVRKLAGEPGTQLSRPIGGKPERASEPATDLPESRASLPGVFAQLSRPPRRPPLLRLLLSPGLEERDDLLVDLFGPGRAGAARAVADVEDGVGCGHVAVVGAVDHERRRDDVPDIAGGVEPGAGHRLLVVGSQGGRIGLAPAYD